jgi:hypothetical protein
MSFRISRRTLFSTSGGFLALPLLEALSPRRAVAAGNSDPRRLVLIHFANGTMTRASQPNWLSTPDDVALTMANAPIPLQPFPANLSDITLLKYLTQSARNQNLNNGAGGHAGAKAAFFTGQVIGDHNSDVSTIDGDSFDVMYGRRTPQKTSIYLGTSQQAGGDNVTYAYELSHKDGRANPPEINPVSFYNSYFAPLGGGTAPPLSAFARNPRILNVPTDATAALRARLGKQDRLTLDSFTQALADLKAHLTPAGTAPVCPAPPMPMVQDPTSSSPTGMAYFERMQAFNSLIAVGFQCDLFRSVAISFGTEGHFTSYDGVYPASLNYNGGTLTIQYDHSVSHQSPVVGEAGGYGVDNNLTRDRVHMYLVVDLINKLKAIQDPSGSAVLDNTAIMAGFCVDDGQHDSGSSLGTPVIVAGGRNFMTPGRSLNCADYDLNDLYFTLSGFLGMGLTSFFPIMQSDHPYGSDTGRMSGSNVLAL